jgi:hypothetical protein
MMVVNKNIRIFYSSKRKQEGRNKKIEGTDGKSRQTVDLEVTI